MSLPIRLWCGFSPGGLLLDGMKAAAMRSGALPVFKRPPMAVARTFATREELLERLRQAKAQEMLQQDNPVHVNMWRDRRTYMMLATLVAATGWGYR